MPSESPIPRAAGRTCRTAAWPTRSAECARCSTPTSIAGAVPRRLRRRRSAAAAFLRTRLERKAATRIPGSTPSPTWPATPTWRRSAGTRAYHYELAGRRENRARRARFAIPVRGGGACSGPIPAIGSRSCAPKWTRPSMPHKLAQRRSSRTKPAAFDLAAHFAYRGWRLALDPNHGLQRPSGAGGSPGASRARRQSACSPPSSNAATAPHAGPVPDEDDPGLLTTRFARHHLFGIADRLQALAKRRKRPPRGPEPAYDDPVERSSRTSWTRSYYLATYRDVREHQIDPVEHFCRHRLDRSGRNPSHWFDTAYYLPPTPTSPPARSIRSGTTCCRAARKAARRTARAASGARSSSAPSIPNVSTRSWSRPDAPRC